MSYSDIYSSNEIKSRFFVKIGIPTKLTLNPSDVYNINTSIPSIDRCWYLDKVNNKYYHLLPGTPGSLNDKEFSFNQTTGVLTVYWFGLETATVNDYILYTEDPLFFSTESNYFFLKPTDSNSKEVFWDGKILSVPKRSISMRDISVGIMPSIPGYMSVSTVDNDLVIKLSNSSIYNSFVEIYETINELTSSNSKLIFSGTIVNYDITDTEVNFEIKDLPSIFSQTATTPILGAGANQKVLPDVSGVKDGYRCILADSTHFYFGGNSFETTNTKYSFATYYVRYFTGDSPPANTTTRTYVPVRKFVGDTVVLCNYNSGVPNYNPTGGIEYVTVTASGTDSGYNYIEHAALLNPMFYYSWILMSPIHKVTIIQDGKNFTPMPHRDYYVSGFDILYIGFNAAVVSNLGLARMPNENDLIIVRLESGYVEAYPVNGYTGFKDYILATRSITVNYEDSRSSSITNPIVKIFSYLVDHLKIRRSDIDIENFCDQIIDTQSDTVSFSIPVKSSEQVPSYRDLISGLLQTVLMRLFVDTNGKWKLSKIGPMPLTPTLTLSDSDILKDSFKVEFDHSDIASEIVVEYDFREYQDVITDEIGKPKISRRVNSETAAKFRNTRSMTFTSYHFDQSRVDILAKRLSFIYSDRRCLYKFALPAKFKNVNIGDTIEIIRSRLPGFLYTENQMNSVKGVVVEIEYLDDRVNIVIDDQKGIEDNKASW